ncbi:MAG TPA: protein kinase [Kofleriaceae bacterium]|nr:protein kinase [Kofleriaceae bacterium]
MEAASTASEARRFGKYTLVAKLATGGMAEIFLARLHGDGGFEKLVCIKRILPHLAKDPQFVAMFLDEARVAARISHPNVCQVFELGECEGQYYIAMEYLEGVPLSLFRRRDFYPGLPDPRLVAGFGVQACEGLHHAHQLKRTDGELLGVVHRDISPQNLFATTDGIVKVLDFGIAKVQDASVRTSTGAVKGTYAYMAPEQLRNEKLDRRVDVWALGVVLWETLAQQYLFRRDTEFLTFEAITKLPIPDLHEVRPDVPPLLADTIARALSRNPDDRFASARALGEALGQAVGPLGGIAQSATISDEVSRSFEATLAEQRMLLRIAREGGQFDLERSSSLVAHGTSMSATPVSNIHRRVEEAKAEVAQFVAASQAIDSLYEDEGMKSRPHRFGTDGAFTPAPSRRSGGQDAVPDESGIIVKHASEPMRAQSVSGPYAVAPAEWRYDETAPPVAVPPRMSGAVAMQAPRGSRLPWMIATVAIASIAAAAAIFYMEVREQKSATPAQAQPEHTEAVVMNATAPTPPPAAPVVAEVSQDAAAALPSADENKVTPPSDVEAKKADTKRDKSNKTARVEKKVDKVGEVKKADKKPDKIVEKKQDKVEKTVEKTPEPVKAVAQVGPPGTITIDSAPVYAVIYIDGKKYGETPVVNIKLAAGKHSVRAVSPSGSTQNLTINIESGKSSVRRIGW